MTAENCPWRNKMTQCRFAILWYIYQGNPGWEGAHTGGRVGTLVTPFALVVLNSAGEHRDVRASSEDELVAFLKTTWRTLAPISFRYADGSPIDRETMDRLHKRFFAESVSPTEGVSA